jgi:hypothetical protein
MTPSRSAFPLPVEEPDGRDLLRRRVRTLLAMAAVAAVAAVGLIFAVVVVLTHPSTDVEPPHPGQLKATVVSPDGRLDARIYLVTRFFTLQTEVTLRRATGAQRGLEVSLGCTENDDGVAIDEVYFAAADTVTARDYNGTEHTITFDPITLQPETTIGPC